MSPPRQHAFYVAGLGAVGLGMARALRAAGWSLVGAWNRGEPRRAQAAETLGIEVAASLGAELNRAELVLVCVADDAVPELGARLAESGHLRPGAVVAHTSGLLAGDALGSIPDAHQGSLHPLVAVPTGADGEQVLRGAPMAVEGDESARQMLDDVADALGGRPFSVAADSKVHYHAAAVMASNLVVALLGEAMAVADVAAVERSREWMVELAAGAVARVGEAGPLAALTGPLVRGDIETVRRHLQALPREQRALYILLSRHALRIARDRGLDAEVAGRFEQLFDAGD